MILLKNFFVNTTEDIDVISIIHETNRAIAEAAVPEGLASIIVPAPGGALAIIETLPDMIEQLKAAIRVFPVEGIQAKNKRKEDINIGSRVAAAMLGRTLQIPISGGKLILAPREEVVLVDLETTARRREFYVQVVGDAPQQAGQQQARGPAQRKK